MFMLFYLINTPTQFVTVIRILHSCYGSDSGYVSNVTDCNTILHSCYGLDLAVILYGFHALHVLILMSKFSRGSRITKFKNINLPQNNHATTCSCQGQQCSCVISIL